MIFLGIDPGPVETAICVFDPDPLVIPAAWKLPNQEALRMLKCWPLLARHHFTIEMIASYGMSVGAEVFETCAWIGRFWEARPAVTDRVTRIQVKSHICHSSKANDSNIRQALIDRYGGKDAAIGNKKTPGPLYGFSGDMWAALAVAITAAETTERYIP